MWKNHFKVALRRLLRYRRYTLLHLTGLGLGVTACLLIASYVWHEHQYDRFHRNGKRICRLNTDLILPDQTLELALAAGPAAPALQEAFPGVESFVRFARPWSKLLVERNGDRRYEAGILYADSSAFAVFNFPLVSGDPSAALAAPYRLVLTQSKARAWFGASDPIGEQLTVDGKQYQVSGVMADPPKNSHLQFDLLLSFASWVVEHPPTNANWGWTPFPTYILLKEGVKESDIRRQLPDFLAANVNQEDPSMRMALHLQALESIHFGPSRLGELQPVGNRNLLFFLSAAALLILLLAVANYVNLAMAVHIGRMREIGVLKTVGATGLQVGRQHLAEGIVLSLTAVVLAAAASAFLAPVFGRWVGRDLTFDMNHAPILGGVLLIFAGLLGVITAAYPSAIAARLRPAAIFQGKGLAGLDKVRLRRLLTTGQFAVSIALLIGAIVVWRQLDYLAKKDLGFGRSGKLVIDFGNAGALNRPYHTVKAELSRTPGVSGVAFSSHVPAQAPHNVATLIRKADGQEARAEADLFLVDFDFIDLYGLKIIAGRKFDPAFSQDTTGALILSRSAVQLLGFSRPEEIIGLEFRQWDWQGRVVGVVEDFNYQSLHQEPGPVTFQVRPELFEKLTVQFNTRDMASTLEQVGQSWTRIAGHLPFQYNFLDEGLAKQYESDKRFGRLISLASALALLLACLGLAGLVAYACRQRAKTIAIRKVFGASARDVIRGLLRDFGRPVLWAWLLVIGPSYWLLDRWLLVFAYRLPVAGWTLAAGGAAVLFLVGLIVVWQSYGMARANPVEYLREE